MDIQADEKVKQDAAAQVDQWFVENPQHWREKAQEVIAACLTEPSPLDDIQGMPNIRRNEVTIPTFTDDARALRSYYLACIILHDASENGYKAIGLDLWPAGGIPVAVAVTTEDGEVVTTDKGEQALLYLDQPSKAQVSLWDAALYVFDKPYGDKSDFIAAALRTVEKDLAAGRPKKYNKRKGVKEAVAHAMKKHPETKSPKQLLPHVNQILRSFNQKPLEDERQIKKNMSIIRGEQK
jgi:hypothetical protein